MQNIFEIKDVRYKSILSIDYLEIKASSITCIVGESGGGKTTLLRLLNKLISPTEGHIFFHGDDLESLDTIEHRKHVSLLSQKPYIYPKTIKDNFIKALSFHKCTIDDKKMIELLNAVHLNKPLDNTVETLSGGEAQRLALARVMALDSNVILLDEPSSALDDQTEKLVIEKIVDYVEKNHKTLVMVTHSIQVAKQYADTIYTINHGKLERSVTNGH